VGMKYLALALLICSAQSPLLAGQYPPHCAQNLFCLFNQGAVASDPAGVHKYSEDLIGLIVPPETGKADTEPLANRLARAEQVARAGSGKLVAEADVVRAFNELMAKIGAPSSLRADEASMRRFREHAVSIKAFPALLSAVRNGTNCNPGEAVFLLYLLISDDGVLYERNLDSAKELMQPYGQQSGGVSVSSASQAPRMHRGCSPRMYQTAIAKLPSHCSILWPAHSAFERGCIMRLKSALVTLSCLAASFVLSELTHCTK